MSTLHLDKLLNPATIAVVGASDREGSPGKALTRNLLNGNYSGELYLVNPKYTTIADRPAFRTVKHLPVVPDLVVVISPPRTLHRVLVQCARHGARVVLMMTGHDNGKALHALARKAGIRLLGPWCAGLIRPHLGLNASFATNRIAPGSLAVVSQSASLGAAMLDWSEVSGVGFSALVSTGEDTDITLADLLDLLAEDYRTRAIIVYLEHFRHPRSLLSALSAAARSKPVVFMKSAQDADRYCDALARSGRVHSSDDVLEAALARAGVLRIRSFANLFAAAKLLASDNRIAGRRIAILSNGAAPANLAYEQLREFGFELVPADAGLLTSLGKATGKPLSGSNPLVMRHPGKLAHQYQAALDTLVESNRYDGILLIFVPDYRNEPTAIADAVAHLIASRTRRRIPVLTCWMGESSVLPARERFAELQIATFRTPEAAAKAFDFLLRHHSNQQMLLQLPNPASRSTRADVPAARKLVARALQKGLRVTGPQLSRQLLGCFEIEVLPAFRATDIDEALDAAATIGYPVAMSLVAPNVVYTEAIVGVQMPIDNEADVRNAYALIVQRMRERRADAEFRGVLVEKLYAEENHRSIAVSLFQDPTFGPVIAVGIGGELAPIAQTRALALPPLNQFLIEQMLAHPALATYLGQYRHLPPVDAEPLVHVLRRLSELACELPEIFSIDIHALKLAPGSATAMDIEIVLEQRSLSRRYDHLAIHPYPWQWVRPATLKGDVAVTLRPIRPEDGDSIAQLVRRMSAESRYMRFMHHVNELSPHMVAQFTKLDYDRHMAFVAEAPNQDIVGVSRYTIGSDRHHGEFAIAIDDDWQGIGLATALMNVLIEHARSIGILEIHGDVLRRNEPMHRLMHALQFVGRANPEDPDMMIFSRQLTDRAA